MRGSSVFLSVVLSLSVLQAEPSAFERQSGATKKDIKNLKDSSINLSGIVTELQNRLNALEQSQYGIQSLYDGQSQSVQGILTQVQDIELKLAELKAKLDILQEQNIELKEQNLQYAKEIKDNRENLKLAETRLKELADVGVKLNELMSVELGQVKEELKKQANVIVQDQENIKKLSLELEKLYEAKKKQQEKNAFKDPNKKPQVFEEAKKLYWDKRFDDSRLRFSWLFDEGYKKAESSFFLGQIAYRQKRYQDAVYYYKVSAVENQKAEYMPILFLHTIKSFRALGDKQKAIDFIDILIANHPQTKEAKEAQQIKAKLQSKSKQGVKTNGK
ncbi:tol-pal system YbgF family protein [Helicobacter enhydrae]|uniref:hypothetical protein n=1 Tax=Helicobacter enhydrae TaxID=222136 RepID=UPI0018FF2F4F|nr:hypothetical protein [Helicobacter enhydrae]